jgi:hypothetical protein
MAGADRIPVIARLGREFGRNHLFAHGVNTHIHTIHDFLKLSRTVANKF